MNQTNNSVLGQKAHQLEERARQLAFLEGKCATIPPLIAVGRYRSQFSPRVAVANSLSFFPNFVSCSGLVLL